MPFFAQNLRVGGGKSFLRQKMTKVMTFFGGKGGGGGELFFLKIHSIYDLLLIGSFNKSFLEILQK